MRKTGYSESSYRNNGYCVATSLYSAGIVVGHDGEITAFQSSCTFSSQLYFQLRKSLHKIYTILCSTKYKLHKFPPQSTKDLRGKL
jgi:hypothetical protein